ncbi:MAG: hypothetical protein ABS76_18995 [Pelagibacterium sp. SCN 64-44]|nr:MAG: hypothetical protein ABS76_18995 [Pelagibacterium sp. SCN 64-44]
MNRQQEKLFLATLCGFVLVAASAFAVQPAMAAGYHVEQPARVTGVARSDELNVRKWPAAYSQKLGGLTTGSRIWVERCIEATTGSDWCLIEGRTIRGWVNSRYLTLARR